MLEAHNMAQWLQSPEFEQDIRNALVDHCMMFGPSSKMIHFVFGGEVQCEPIQQLLVDAYCLHACKDNYISDPPDDDQDAQSWLTASTRFRNRVMRKMVQVSQSTGIKQLNREDYAVDGLHADT